MRAKRLLEDILSVVSEQTDVEADKIMGRRRDIDVVDARHICIKLLSDNGIYKSTIAELMNMTTRNVHYVLSGFESRAMFDRVFRNNYERAAKQLRKRLEASDL